MGGQSSRMGKPKGWMSWPMDTDMDQSENREIRSNDAIVADPQQDTDASETGDLPLCLLLVSRLQRLGCPRVLISCQEHQYDEAPARVKSSCEVEWVFDDASLGDIGPARGLLSAAARYPTAHFLVLACDFPFATYECISYLLQAWSRANERENEAMSKRHISADASHPPSTIHPQSHPVSPLLCYQHPEDGAPEPLFSIWSCLALQRLRWNATSRQENPRPRTGPCYTIKQILGINTNKKGNKAKDKGKETTATSMEESKQAEETREHHLHDSTGLSTIGAQSASSEPSPSLSPSPAVPLTQPASSYLLLPPNSYCLLNTNTPEQWQQALEVARTIKSQQGQGARAVDQRGQGSENTNTSTGTQLQNRETSFGPNLWGGNKERAQSHSAPAISYTHSLEMVEREARNSAEKEGLHIVRSSSSLHNTNVDASSASPRSSSSSPPTSSAVEPSPSPPTPSSILPDCIETVPLHDAVGRVVCCPIVSPLNLPLFDNAAMDGFVVRSVDTVNATPEHPVTLKVVGCIAAGDQPPTINCDDDEIDGGSGKSKWAGTAFEIMTGAPFPTHHHPSAATPTAAGEFDACVRIEDVSLVFDDQANGRRLVAIQLSHPARAGQHRRHAGEDIQVGSELLQPGTMLTPEHVLVLASVGLKEVRVRRKLRVLIMPTGKELIDGGGAQALEAKHGQGCIPESNSTYLMALLQSLGPMIEVERVPPVPDSLDALREAFGRALGMSQPYTTGKASSTTPNQPSESHLFDLVVSTGGVSCGRYDLVLDAWTSLGVEKHFHGVAIRPGHPIAFGTWQQSDAADGHMTGSEKVSARIRNVVFFGLPGNPSAVTACARFFLIPFLRARLGFGPEHPLLARSLEKSSNSRHHHQVHSCGKHSAHTTLFQPARLPCPSSRHDDEPSNRNTDADGIRTGTAMLPEVEIVRVPGASMLRPLLHAHVWSVHCSCQTNDASWSLEIQQQRMVFNMQPSLHYSPTHTVLMGQHYASSVNDGLICQQQMQQ